MSSCLQLRTDAFQRQRHLLIERLGSTRREVIGVRVDGIGVSVDEELEHVFALELLDRIGQRHVALIQRLADVVGLLAGQLQAQPVVHDRLAPQHIQLLVVCSPWHVLTVVLELVVAAEIEVLLEQIERVFDALIDTLLVEREHLEGRLQIATAQCIANAGLQRSKAVDIGLSKELLAAVQRFQIALEHVLDIASSSTRGR